MPLDEAFTDSGTGSGADLNGFTNVFKSAYLSELFREKNFVESCKLLRPSALEAEHRTQNTDNATMTGRILSEEADAQN